MLIFVTLHQVHTTGIDIKQPFAAVAAVTLGKDLVLRDYKQGCWRLRGIGKGQSIVVAVIDEVQALVQSTVAAAGLQLAVPGSTGMCMKEAVLAWLIVRSIEAERIQHLQLVKQQLQFLWRRRYVGVQVMLVAASSLTSASWLSF